MNNDEQVGPPELEQEEHPGSKISGYPKSDPILRILVDSINRSGGLATITLSVSGGVVSGDLIGRAEFFELLADAVGHKKSEELSEDAPVTLGAYFKSLAELPEEEGSMPCHIHVKNAFYITGARGVPRDGGTLWRGRLTEVSGWSIGKITFGIDLDE